MKFESDYVFIEPDREGCHGYVMQVQDGNMIGEIQKVNKKKIGIGAWQQVTGYTIYLCYYCLLTQNTDTAAYYSRNAYYKLTVLRAMANWYLVNRIQKKPAKFKKYKL